MNRYGMRFQSPSDVYIPATLALEQAIDHVVVPFHRLPRSHEDERISSSLSLSSTNCTSKSRLGSESHLSKQQQQQHDTLMLFPNIRWSDSGANLRDIKSSKNSSSRQDLKRRLQHQDGLGGLRMQKNKAARKISPTPCKKKHQLRKRRHLLRCMSVRSRLDLLGLDSLNDHNDHEHTNSNQRFNHLFLTPIFLLPASSMKEDGATLETTDDANDWSFNVVG